MHGRWRDVVRQMRALDPIASCGAIAADIPVGEKRHNRFDGSVLKAVEDMNWKRWPVLESPTLDGSQIPVDNICGVSIEARHSAFGQDGPFPLWTPWWLHPETNERIERGLWITPGFSIP